MTAAQFKSELSKAQSLGSLEVDPDKAAYWQAYCKGLRQNWHGDKFGTETGHDLLTEAATSVDAGRRTLGRGYRDGLNYGKGQAA